MSDTMSTYGFAGYDDDVVDDRHLLACNGCWNCGEALDRAWEREYIRLYGRSDPGPGVDPKTGKLVAA